VEGPGKFKCPRCEGVLVAEQTGKVSFMAPKEARPVSVTLPAQPELVKGLAPLAEGVARRVGFDGDVVGKIGSAVVAAAQGVMEIAYGGDTTAVVHLIMVPDGKLFRASISDYGKPIAASADGRPQDGRFEAATGVMDSVELRPNPKGGNLITLTKRAGG
jgi:anti-sigma regulatory factor (Ser/Thr protein kinase)